MYVCIFYMTVYRIACMCSIVHGEVDLVGLKPMLKTTTSFNALTLLVGSFNPQNPVPPYDL